MEMRLHNRMVSVSGTAAEIATVLESIAWRVLPGGSDEPPGSDFDIDLDGLVSIWDDE